MMSPVVLMKADFALGALPCRDGVVNICEPTKDFHFLGDGDVSDIHAFSLGVGHSGHPASVISANTGVARVLSAVNRSEIAPSVIGPVAVDVVNFVRGFSRLHEPDDAVRHEALTKHSDADVAIGALPASNLSSVLGIPGLPRCFSGIVAAAEIALRSALPMQKAGVWVVSERATKRVPAGQFKIGHSSLLHRLFDLADEAVQMFSSAHLITLGKLVKQ